MKQKYSRLGLESKEERAKHMNDYCKRKGDSPTVAEIKAYLKVMDLHIAEKQQAEQDELPI
ncbi:hypothetical protein D3C78_1892550 [compost metagenome]